MSEQWNQWVRLQFVISDLVRTSISKSNMPWSRLEINNFNN
jgi:hypothetical protein